jgi:hypothetical protein
MIAKFGSQWTKWREMRLKTWVVNGSRDRNRVGGSCAFPDAFMAWGLSRNAKPAALLLVALDGLG